MIGRLALVLVLAGTAWGQVIVTPQWVRGHPEARVVEASWGAAAQAGYLPGAVHADTDWFEDGRPSWHLLPLERLRAVMGRLGIRAGDTVVVYSQQTIAAARVWWILYYAGVRDVRYLDGGAAAWRRAGFALVRRPRRAVAVEFGEVAPRREALATAADVLAGGAVLADVRSREEFDGKTSGYDYLERKGRIPGAVHVENGDDGARVYQQEDGRLRPLAEIAELWRRRGVTPDRAVIFYCGSGWRSSLAYLYAVALGYRRVRNYSDGWSGWSTRFEAGRQGDSGRPVELP